MKHLHICQCLFEPFQNYSVVVPNNNLFLGSGSVFVFFNKFTKKSQTLFTLLNTFKTQLDLLYRKTYSNFCQTQHENNNLTPKG